MSCRDKNCNGKLKELENKETREIIIICSKCGLLHNHRELNLIGKIIRKLKKIKIKKW
nr:MAG: hypothetical protein [uncultured archaeon]